MNSSKVTYGFNPVSVPGTTENLTVELSYSSIGYGCLISGLKWAGELEKNPIFKYSESEYNDLRNRMTKVIRKYLGKDADKSKSDYILSEKQKDDIRNLLIEQLLI